MGAKDRLMHAWNAFNSERDEVGSVSQIFNGSVSTYNALSPGRARMTISNERSIVTAIYSRLAIDFSSIAMRHVMLDKDKRYQNDVDDGLNNCLTLEANIDQGARAFRQDLAMTMFDKGVIAIVPVDTTLNPGETGGYDILSMRIGHITQWWPRHVRVSLYNDRTGKRQEIVLEKKFVTIVENPFYSVMNEPNSTLQRLIRKLNILDAVDEASGSGKLDLIIQLPYVIKSEARKKAAEQRRDDIEFQLKGSKYGIAYADGTEKITQLNRPAENNLMGQIEYLVDLLYSQLGITPEIMNGTADEATMLNYLNRSIEPILDAVVEGMKRTFLTKTARTQGHSIEYFRDAFKLVPLSQMADIVDKLGRNEVLSSNEFRSVLGFKPSKDKNADKLMNSNMPQPPAPSEPVDPNSTPKQEGE